MGDPPSAGDNAGVPGRAVTQGHRASLRQRSWRDRFTYKQHPTRQGTRITHNMKFCNFHTRCNPACELSLRERSAGAGTTARGRRLAGLSSAVSPRLLRVPTSAPRKVPDGFLITQLVAPWRSACTYMSPGKEATQISPICVNYRDHSS